MAREISITFALNAALKSGFTAAFQSATSSARGVSQAVREMERSATGKLGASIIAQREKIHGLSGSLKEARATLATLQEKAQTAGGSTGILARQIELASGKVRNLSGALDRQIGQWKTTVAETTTACGSVRNLANEYANLQARMNSANHISRSLHANMATADVLRNQRADLQGRLLSTAATTASVAMPVKLAISAEDTFADLRKVMDAPEETMHQVFADAQAMSNQTGKSFEDVITIMTAAAQAGLGKTREELLGVTDQAVKMSIAWGVSAEAAGKSMATWQAGMGLTAEQARHTGDVINALSNEMNAEAGEINKIFTRLGPLMKGSGVATQDIAALATAFKAAGAEVEVSGTAMKNFVKVMAAGSAGLTDERKGIYQYLQIDPDELQRQLYTDSKGAILRVLEALKNVNPEELNGIASRLFGEESVAAITPLIGQLEQLKKAYAIANGDVKGSVDDEYANRMKTTATSISQMTQSIRNLGVSAGQTLLPVVGAVAQGITGVVGNIGSLVQRFPRVTSVVMTAGAAIAGLAVGTLAFGLIINTVKTSLNSVRGLFLRLAASQISTAATTNAASASAGIFGVTSRVAGAGARFFAGGLRSILFATGVGAVLVGIGYGLNLLIENWDTVTQVMANAWNWVTDTWGRLGVFFTELGHNLLAIFPGIWDGICSVAASAKDIVLSIWQGVGEFFTGLWNGILTVASYIWQGINILATWAYNGVCGAWQGAVGFFDDIVSGISGIFSRLFGWLRENFSWVFSTIDAVSGFIGKLTGAGKDAWKKAFGDKDSPAANANAAKNEPITSTGDTNPKTPPPAPVAQDLQKKQISKPSFAEYTKAMEDAKKSGSKKRSGGGSKKSSKHDSGPVTIVSLAGDNSKPQTIFIPASRHDKSPLSVADNPAGAVKMPAVNAAREVAAIPRALPRTPQMLAAMKKGAKTQEKPNSIHIDLEQNFDLIAQDSAAVKKVLESLKPDFELLVRRALEKISSDKRRTAYAQ